MRILGLDPGTRVVGYGVIDVVDNKIVGIAAGVWRLDAKQHIAYRLAQLAVELRKTIESYRPTHLSLELAFLAENVRSALYLGQSRGVVLSESHQMGLLIHEISATSAKKMLTGYGRADKTTVSQMVSKILKLDVASLPHDATDALCIAYALAVKVNQTQMTLVTELSTQQQELLKEWGDSNRLKRKGRKSDKDAWARALAR